jgi:hypothetical protein
LCHTAPAAKHIKLIFIEGVLEPHDQCFGYLDIALGTAPGLLICTDSTRLGAIAERSGVMDELSQRTHRGDELKILKVHQVRARCARLRSIRMRGVLNAHGWHDHVLISSKTLTELLRFFRPAGKLHPICCTPATQRNTTQHKAT